MAKILATAVHLTDDGGIVHSFLPGQKVPKEFRDRITNPKAWADSDATEEEVETETPAPPASDIPRKNASRDAWAAYADSKGIEVDGDAKRDDIIAGLAANGIPVE